MKIMVNIVVVVVDCRIVVVAAFPLTSCLMERRQVEQSC
jgi:hypothetical protein